MERKQHADLIDEVCETFRRDGRLADLGEELGVTDLAEEKRQRPGADTNEFGVCVAQKHRDVDVALLLHHKKELGPVDKEGVHEVRVNVGPLVNEHARENVDV